MKKNQIFLVEDDRPTIDIYRTAFEFAKINVEIVDLGEKAIDIIRKVQKGEKEAPEIIILDLILPDISGIEILKEIKSNEKTRLIPVFVFSNYSDNEIEKMKEELKPEKVMLKTDYSPREVVEMMKKRLKEIENK